MYVCRVVVLCLCGGCCRPTGCLSKRGRLCELLAPTSLHRSHDVLPSLCLCCAFFCSLENCFQGAINGPPADIWHYPVPDMGNKRTSIHQRHKEKQCSQPGWGWVVGEIGSVNARGRVESAEAGCYQKPNFDTFTPPSCDFVPHIGKRPRAPFLLDNRENGMYPNVQENILDGLFKRHHKHRHKVSGPLAC